MHSKQAANPCAESRNCREYDEEFAQLALDIKPVFSAVARTGCFRIKVLEEMESAQQEIVKKDHVIDLIYGKHDDKSCQNVNPFLKPSQMAITKAPRIIRMLKIRSVHPNGLAP